MGPSFPFYDFNNNIFSLIQYGSWQYSNNFFDRHFIFFVSLGRLFCERFTKLAKIYFLWEVRQTWHFWIYFRFSACQKIRKKVIMRNIFVICGKMFSHTFHNLECPALCRAACWWRRGPYPTSSPAPGTGGSSPPASQSRRTPAQPGKKIGTF